jgi:hypothetical protein
MTLYVVDARAHVHILVSIVKMATMLKEQHSVVRFFMGKRTQCKGYS